MKVDTYNFQNAKVGTVELPDELFASPWKPALVKQVLEAQLANLRRPWAHAKGRGEVSGGGKKPWRQKGTGRARHGSIRSPLWIGGGKAHGPSADRDYSQKVNRKMRQAALASLLSKKLKDGEVKVFDSFALEAKTKVAAENLRNALGLKKQAKKFDVLLVPRSEEKNLVKSARNLEKTKVLSPNSLNVYDVMNYKFLFLDQEAIATIKSSNKTRS